MTTPDVALAAALSVAADTLTETGPLVTYRRQSDSVSLRAAIGRTRWEGTDENGVVYYLETRDFLVREGDLVLNGAKVLPQRGDTIEETTATDKFTYAVSAPAGQQPWRFTDSSRTRIRIHTTLIKREDPPLSP